MSAIEAAYALLDTAPSPSPFCPGCGCDELSWKECGACRGTGAYTDWYAGGFSETIACDECEGGHFYQCEGCGQTWLESDLQASALEAKRGEWKAMLI